MPSSPFLFPRVSYVFSEFIITGSEMPASTITIYEACKAFLSYRILTRCHPILFIYLHDKILHFHLLLLKKMQRGKSLDSTKDFDFSVHLIKQTLH